MTGNYLHPALLSQVPTGIEQSLSPVAVANPSAGISRQNAGLLSISTATDQAVVESRNRPDDGSVSLKRTLKPPSRPLIPVPIKRIKQASGIARSGVGAVVGISPKQKKTKAPQPRGERLDKFPADVIIREKTTGEGSLAKVGSIVDVYHQFRDRNGTVFFRQLEGEPVGSLPITISVWLNPS